MALLGCLFFCHVQDEFVSVKPENPHFVSLGGYGSWRRTLFPNHRQNEEVGATGLSFTSTSLCICLRRRGKRRKRLPALEGSREGNLCLISLGNPFCSFLVLLATLSKNPSIASLRKKKKGKKTWLKPEVLLCHGCAIFLTFHLHLTCLFYTFTGQH